MNDIFGYSLLFVRNCNSLPCTGKCSSTTWSGRECPVWWPARAAMVDECHCLHKQRKPLQENDCCKYTRNLFGCWVRIAYAALLMDRAQRLWWQPKAYRPHRTCCPMHDRPCLAMLIVCRLDTLHPHSHHYTAAHRIANELQSLRGTWTSTSG